MLILNHDCCALFNSSIDLWDLYKSFDAALAMKASRTIIKRSLDLERFSTWCVDHEVNMLPLSEQTLWMFLQDMIASAKPSAPWSIIQAINFAIHALNANPPLDLPRFPAARIKGLCDSHRAKGGPIQHALPLSVTQIQALEVACTQSTDSYQTLVISSILVAREIELLDYTSKDKEILYLEQGKLATRKSTLPSTSTNDALKLHFCFLRRALALDLAKVFSFDVINRYHQQLLSYLSLKAPRIFSSFDQPGYQCR